MRFAALALLVGLSSAARAAEPDTYIFDVLALQPYKGSFARLVKGKEVPDWVKAIAVQGSGTAGPTRTVDVGGTPYRLDRVCEVGACAGNTLDVLWAPRGMKVWAALVEGGKPPVMLGDPKGAQEKELEAAANGAAAATPAAAPALAPASPVAAPPTASPVATPASASAAVTPPAATARAAEPDTYIFDLLPLQPYKGNFARLVKDRAAPDWVRAISIQGAGTAGPSRTVDVAGTPYRLDRVCKVGACAGNTLDVLWAPRGAKVWAALVGDGRPPVMLGDPKGAQATALAEAVGAGAAGTPPSASAGPSATPQK